MKFKVTVTAIRYVDVSDKDEAPVEGWEEGLKDFTLTNEDGLLPFIEEAGVELFCTVEKVQP